MPIANRTLTGVSSVPRIAPNGVVPRYSRTGGVGGGGSVVLAGAGFTLSPLASAALTVMSGGADDPNYRYVNPAASAGGNGRTWKTTSTDGTHALAALPATPTRGLTYWLADGSYGSRTFSTADSGTTLIQIRKATIASHGTSDGWSDAYGDGEAVFTKVTFTTGNWVWDGTKGGGPGSWTTGFGFRIAQTNDHSLEFMPTSGSRTNVTCRHFSIIGTRNQTAGADAIRIGNIEPYTVSNFTCSYYYLDQISLCPFLLAPGTNNGATNLVFEYGYIGVYGDLSNAIHSEIASIWAGANNVTFRHNVFTYVYSTGGIIYDSQGSAGGLFIYGNVWIKRAGGATWDYPNGIIGSWGNGEVFSNVKVYNNSFIDITPASGSGSILGSSGVLGAGNEFRNNMIVNCPDTGIGSRLFQTQTHNHFINSGASGGTNASTGTGDPFTDKANLIFTLVAPTPAGYSSLAAPYNTDPLGALRGQDGTWDRGAYEFT
jgi:hypothetical protein